LVRRIVRLKEDFLNITNWTFKELEQYVSENPSENTYLDFKDSRALTQWNEAQKDELAKDVSAFANSGGGMLIYGAKEKVQGDGTPRFDGFDGVGIPTSTTRETIENILTSEKYIHRKIDGLLIRPVPVPNVPGAVYLVIYVPRSERAPHMHNPQGRYYKRYNFKSERMQGYEVEDIRNRTVYPQIDFLWKWKRDSRRSTGERHLYAINFSVKNIGTKTANKYRIEVYFPAFLNPTVHSDMQHSAKVDEEIVDRIKHAVYIERRTESKHIIFPGEEIDFLELEYSVDDQSFDLIGQGHKFYWYLYLDDAPPQEGAVPLSSINEF